MAEKIKVEVCYALPARQELATVSLPEGATLLQALEASGLLEKYPEIDLKKNKFGVFAKLSKPDAVLRDRDRVEIYRPLIADPKEVRKQRAAEGKVMSREEFLHHFPNGGPIIGEKPHLVLTPEVVNRIWHHPKEDGHKPAFLCKAPPNPVNG